MRSFKCLIADPVPIVAEFLARQQCHIAGGASHGSADKVDGQACCTQAIAYIQELAYRKLDAVPQACCNCRAHQHAGAKARVLLKRLSRSTDVGQLRICEPVRVALHHAAWNLQQLVQ